MEATLAFKYFPASGFKCYPASGFKSPFPLQREITGERMTQGGKWNHAYDVTSFISYILSICYLNIGYTLRKGCVSILVNTSLVLFVNETICSHKPLLNILLLGKIYIFYYHSEYFSCDSIKWCITPACVRWSYDFYLMKSRTCGLFIKNFWYPLKRINNTTRFDKLNG